MTSRYQIVCMVVDRGSLKGAADELGYTQSAVSQAVKALERELGTTLIERGKQGVSLTRDGKQYLPYLRQIVTDEVIDSPRSIVIPEAANRVVSAQVVMKRMLEDLQ